MCHLVSVLYTCGDPLDHCLFPCCAACPPERFIHETTTIFPPHLCPVHKAELELRLSRLADTIFRAHRQQLLAEYQYLQRGEPNAFIALMDSIREAADNALRAVCAPSLARAGRNAAVERQGGDRHGGKWCTGTDDCSCGAKPAADDESDGDRWDVGCDDLPPRTGSPWPGMLSDSDSDDDSVGVCLVWSSTPPPVSPSPLDAVFAASWAKWAEGPPLWQAVRGGEDVEGAGAGGR
ncbi:hypothetical protein MMC13_006323 [Lambiella insularis]|nr:hypothetical protein [Lambiella insularis]